MIRKVAYKDIDFDKYTKCFENSVQRKYSASKEFLDIVTKKQWHLLVFNDYEAVMPVPYSKRYFLEWVDRPRLCQQLGVFSKEDSKELNDTFLDFLLKNFKVKNYSFNATNQFSNEYKSRKNYYIPKQNYEAVFSKYSPKRKRKLRWDEHFKDNLEIKTFSDLFSESEDFILKNMKGSINENETKKYLELLRSFAKDKKMFFKGFFLKEKLINLLAIYEDAKCLALLGTFNDFEYIKLNGASILIDDIIKKHISDKDFDFEGGEIPQVEEFFRGFRPELEKYVNFGFSKKKMIKNLITNVH